MPEYHVQRLPKYGANLAASLPIKNYDTTLCSSTISKSHKIPCIPNNRNYTEILQTQKVCCKSDLKKIDMLLLFTEFTEFARSLLEFWLLTVRNCYLP